MPKTLNDGIQQTGTQRSQEACRPLDKPGKRASNGSGDVDNAGRSKSGEVEARRRQVGGAEEAQGGFAEGAMEAQKRQQRTF